MKKGVTAISIVILLLIAATVLLNRPGTEAASAAAAFPHYGLAAHYPGDVGIESDSSVVFHDNFESGEIPVRGGRWTDVSNRDGRVLSFVADSAPGSSGRRSLKMTATKGLNTGGHLWKLLDRGYDRLYMRFYCKFAPDHPYVHHFAQLGGKSSPDLWPERGAGLRPTGYDRFTTAIDLNPSNADPPGTWNFYTYWAEMRSWQSAEGVSDGRPNPYYGNLFGPDEPVQARRGEWLCVEIMIKLNSAPDKRDGEQAFWIDGRPAAHWGPGSHMGRWYGAGFRVFGSERYQHIATRDSVPLPFEGFLWSRSDQLKINVVEILYYLAAVFQDNRLPADTTIPYNSDVARVRIDDVVAATGYIGPIAADAWSRWDFDGNGRPGIGDLRGLLKLRAAYPEDMRTDYDGNGKLNMMDPLRMMMDLVRGRAGG